MNYISEFYKKENNIFQSSEWLEFQKEYGREIIQLEDYWGIVFELPFKKKFVWIQKGPEKIDINKIKRNLPAGTVFVRVEPAISPKAKGAKEIKKGSLLSGQASPKATLVLDITTTEEEILNQMKPKTRYNIRLAEKKGVEVKRLDNEEVLCELLQKTAAREKGYSPHPKEYYSKMIKKLSGNEMAHIFVAQHEGDFLAAILISFFGNTAIYLHGGFDNEKRNLMAPYLCHWEAIKYAKENGCKFYDFWGIAETDDPKEDWAGITKFKKGFGGNRVIFAGTFDIPIKKIWYNLFSIAAKIRKVF